MTKDKSYLKSKYLWAGMFFLILQIIVIVRNYFSDYLYFFWFCDFAPGILALAFFLKREHLAKAVVNFGIIFQVVYIFLFVDSYLAGGLVEELIYSPLGNFAYLSATILFHLSTSFALLLTYKTKPNLKTITYSILVIAAIYLASLFFTPYELNINLVRAPFEFIRFNIPYYVYLWPALAFLFSVLPIQGAQYLLYKLSLKKR